jgi:hypothetical protein
MWNAASAAAYKTPHNLTLEIPYMHTKDPVLRALKNYQYQM